MTSLISHFFMGLSQAQVHFEDVQSTFGIREVNLSGCAVSIYDIYDIYDYDVRTCEQHRTGICRNLQDFVQSLWSLCLHHSIKSTRPKQGFIENLLKKFEEVCWKFNIWKSRTKELQNTPLQSLFGIP